MKVEENIYLGREKIRSLGGIDLKKMKINEKKILEKIELKIREKKLMMKMYVEKVKIVEIEKEISKEDEVILMEEKKQEIGEKEEKKIFEEIESLKERGKGIVYV